MAKSPEDVWVKSPKTPKTPKCGEVWERAEMGGDGRSRAGKLGEMCVNVVCVGIKALNTLLQCFRVNKYT